MIMSHKWDIKFVDMAKLVACWSKDPSTKVGAVIVDPHTQAVVSTGYNGFPRSVNDDGSHPGEPCLRSRWFRPQKYLWVEHAERNAIYNAARLGHSTNGCWLYLSCTPHVCADCARAVIQAGIQKVIGGSIPFGGVGEQWQDHDIVAEIMFKEALVEVRTVE